MKTLLKILGIVILAMTCQSCSLDNDPQDDGNHRLHQDKTSKVYQFKLSLGGDYVEQSEEPLMRASEPNTYVGINVTCKDKSLVDAPTENYAYGVFTSKDNITIDLISGYTYDFEATILRDGTDKYYHDRYINYQSPFGYYPENDNTDDMKDYPTDKVGNFYYNYLNQGIEALGYLAELSCGSAKIEVVDNKNVPQVAMYMFPRVDRFYGIVNGIDPIILAATSGTVDIELKYKCFGLTIDAQSIPQGTSITVKDITERRSSIEAYLVFPQDLVLTPETTSSAIWQGIYSVNDLKSSGSISFDLELTWHSGLNETQKIETSIDVKPGYNKTLKINIDGQATTKFTGNVNLIELSSDLSEDDAKVVDRDFN